MMSSNSLSNVDFFLRVSNSIANSIYVIELYRLNAFFDRAKRREQI